MEPQARYRRALVFTGHMVDLPARPHPRFPPRMEADASREIAAAMDRGRERVAAADVIAVSSLARGGDILAPDRPDLPAQFIDARDLAVWIVGQVEVGQAGVFNATGPAAPLTLGDLLEGCRRIAAVDSRLVWVDEAFLLDAGVAPWSELPLWLPVDRSPELAGLLAVSIEKARAAGLTCGRIRPPREVSGSVTPHSFCQAAISSDGEWPSWTRNSETSKPMPPAPTTATRLPTCLRCLSTST